MIGESVFFISTESSTYTNILLEYVGLLFALLHFFRELLFPIISLFNVSYINGIIPVVTSFLDKLVSLLKSFIELFTLTVIIIFLFRLIGWFLSENKGIEIYPFKVSGDLEKFDERAIPERLVLESRRILKIHQDTNQIFEYSNRKGKALLPHKKAAQAKISRGNSEIGSKMDGVLASETVLPVINMSLSSESIETEISTVGSISIAGVSIPLGELILILKQMRKSQSPSQYITGSIQKNNLEICLIALMGGRRPYSWQLSDRNAYYGEDKINNLTYIRQQAHPNI